MSDPVSVRYRHFDLILPVRGRRREAMVDAIQEALERAGVIREGDYCAVNEGAPVQMESVSIPLVAGGAAHIGPVPISIALMLRGGDG